MSSEPEIVVATRILVKGLLRDSDLSLFQKMAALGMMDLVIHEAVNGLVKEFEQIDA